MTQTNTLPTILDSHGSYALELEGIVNNTITLSFSIEYKGAVYAHNITYRSYNSKLTVRLDAILKSIFYFEPISFEYLETEISDLAKLTITSQSGFTKTFKVINAALPFGNRQTMAYFERRRLGLAHRASHQRYPLQG